VAPTTSTTSGRHTSRATGRSATPEPARPTRSTGTLVRTLWGELAWQLGGKKVYNRIREDDEKGTSPGDVLRDLFNEYGPCLVLIDEWVACARQLHDGHDLPAGTFETQFSFAQVLHCDAGWWRRRESKRPSGTLKSRFSTSS
jgi:predicted AAA+ superfamily ATPase